MNANNYTLVEFGAKIADMAEKRRGDAYNSCQYPPEETGEIMPVQPALLDVPEPDIIPHWRW